MFTLLPAKYTSKTALYLITVVSLTFALCYWIVASDMELPETPQVALKSQPSASSEGLNEEIRTGGAIQLTEVTEVEKQIREIAEKENFKYPDYIIRLGKCESGLNPNARGDGRYNSRGIFQISKFYHPTVTDEQAYDIEYATKWTMDKINAGQQNLWSYDRIIKNKV